MTNKTDILRKPHWLKIKLPLGQSYTKVKEIVSKHNLHTICTSGQCPNMGECWGSGTATLMILGDICTRSCRFCAVKTGVPKSIDQNEAKNVAQSVELMKLKHCVLTSVDRDDLSDGGASVWAETIRAIKKRTPEVTIEALVPDFMGEYASLQKVIEVRPEIISHNLETIKRLTPKIRSKAKYERSLDVVRKISESGIIAKSGIMVGIGETDEEVYETMNDLYNIGCSVMTIGQYLQPTLQHLAVQRYVHPDTFEAYRKAGLKIGFKHIESSPLVRSSYHAEKHIRN